MSNSQSDSNHRQPEMSEERSPVSKIVGNILSKATNYPSYSRKNPSKLLHKNDACCSADLADFLDENLEFPGMFQGRILSDEVKDVVMNVYSFFEQFSRKGASSLTAAACKINKEQHINYVYVSGSTKLVMVQSSHRFGLAASSPNLSEFSLVGWAPVLRLRCAQPRTVRARPQSTPAKLVSDK